MSRAIRMPSRPALTSSNGLDQRLASLRPSRPPPEFRVPDFQVPINLEAAVRRVPSHATSKGMFVARLLSELDQRGIARPTQERFLPFSDYPMRRCLELNAEVARLLFPEQPLAEALRRVAWLSFETFTDSLIGKALFGAVRWDVLAILKLASRAMALTTNVGEYDLQVLRPGAAILHCVDVYCFAECFGVGMTEGMLRTCEVRGQVLVHMDSPTRGAFYVEWSEPER